MEITKNNHYVPQWYQNGFIDNHKKQLCYLTRYEIPLPNGDLKIHHSKKWHTSAQKFYEEHLYSTFFGTEVNDEIEKKLFGPIDDNGSKAIRAFLTDDPSQWNHNFESLFTYLDSQKLRTPKGLDWIKSKYSKLDQMQLMIEMQSLRSIHCTLWAEGIRELVSAEDSDVKFITSDHPVTIYNYALPPNAEHCIYPNDPDISLIGSQTIFPLDKNRCLILTNYEYAREPENANPLQPRTNAARMRHSMVNTIEFINSRKLTRDEVNKINYIIKTRAKAAVAAGKDEWLYPENDVTCDWAELRYVLLPPQNMLYRFSGEMYAKFDDGTVHYQDMFGRTTPPNKYLSKDTDEARLGRNDLCGCGSGKKYKHCCRGVPSDLRTTWDVASIRERNLAFCKCIRDVLGLDRDKNWLDVRKELSEDQITRIYGFYSVLWPRDTDIYSLLPKPDGKFRGLYTGPLDVRVIGVNALPMASLFDEFLIENPVTNPNNVKPDFSPIESPSKYKYQALKEFLFMLEMEPFVRLGLINLIPNPCEFDMNLMRAMMDMTRERCLKKQVINQQDHCLYLALSIEDQLNVTAMMSRKARVQLIIDAFDLDKVAANKIIDELEHEAEASPLLLLQKNDARHSSHYIQFRLSPNFEMSLFIAQATGSVLVTDSGSRWQEFMSAQHRKQGVVSYPWNRVFNHFNMWPIDEQFLNSGLKSQCYFNTLRNHLRTADRMVLENNQDAHQLTQLASQVSYFMKQLVQVTDPVKMNKLNICSPEGGFYDDNVQRLLIRSGCLKYDHKVRSVYGMSIHY